MLKYLILAIALLVVAYHLPTYGDYIRYRARLEAEHESRYLAMLAEYEEGVDRMIEAERKLHELDYVPLTGAYIEAELATAPVKRKRRKR